MGDEPRDMTNEKYLAAEVQGDQVRFSIPTDLLLAKLLLAHLTHAIEVAELSKAIEVRDRVRGGGSNGIVRGDARMLRGPHN